MGQLIPDANPNDLIPQVTGNTFQPAVAHFILISVMGNPSCSPVPNWGDPLQ